MPFSPVGPQPLEAYADTTSVEAGQSIGFSVAVQSGVTTGLTLDIFKSAQIAFQDSQFGLETDLIYNGDYRTKIAPRAGKIPIMSSTFDASVQAVPAGASQNGCSWPIAVSWAVPANTASSVYLARFTRGTDLAWVLFVVRPPRANRGLQSTILCQLSVNTYQAYNPWGGGCLYAPPISTQLLDQVSFDRPCQLWDYLLYDEPIVTWLEANTAVEFCTNVDLNADDTLLDNYQLFVSGGHDEYWSQEMRDRVEGFGSRGGNVAFLGGNTMYRRVELASAGRLMRRVKVVDPTNLQPSWDDFGRPEALTTGLQWSAGHWSTPLPAPGRGYTMVADSSQWMLAGMNLQPGDVIGATDQGGIIGYETDAAVLDALGAPIAPTPASFVTIAQADLPDWPDNGPNGQATMGFFSRDGAGIVAAVGTTGWGQGLAIADANVTTMTANLVNVLRYPSGALVLFKDNNQNGAGSVTSGQVLDRVGWSRYLFAFSGADNLAYAIDAAGYLCRYPDQMSGGRLDPAGIQTIGRGGWNAFTSVFAGGAGVIYAIAADGTLKRYRDPLTGGEAGSEQDISAAGWANAFSYVFAGGNNTIYGVDQNGVLNVFNVPSTGNVTLRAVGQGGWSGFARAFPGGQGTFYAVDQHGNLNWFKDQAGTGAVAGSSGAVVGRSGWLSRKLIFSTGNGNIYAVTSTQFAAAPSTPIAAVSLPVDSQADVRARQARRPVPAE
jgi:hypothetical protein